MSSSLCYTGDLNFEFLSDFGFCCKWVSTEMMVLYSVMEGQRILGTRVSLFWCFVFSCWSVFCSFYLRKNVYGQLHGGFTIVSVHNPVN